MASATTPLSFGAVLKIAGLRRLVLGQLVSIFGDFLAIFAIFSIISFRMHGTATQVSLVLISYFVPFAFVSPVAGVFVDRWNVKRTMIASDLIRAALCSLFLFARTPWQIYAILFSLSVVSTFFIPAQSVTIRTIVPTEGLLSANGLLQQCFYVMQIISPAIAGLLVGTFGPESCFWLDIGSFLVSALMISGIAIHREPAAAQQHVRSVIHEMNEGAKFILTHSTISFVVAAITVGMFAIRAFGALIAVYVRDVLHGGTTLFGLLGSLVGVGMILGALFITRFTRNRSKAHIVVGGLLGIGISIAAIAAIANTAGAVAGMIAMGFCAAFLMVPSQTLLQEETPPKLLGRVGGSMMSVMMTSQVIGLSIAGPASGLIGIRNLYFASAALLVLVAAAGHLKLRNHIAPPPRETTESASA
jgi:DHA3 family macrolide efflux protein-like MFS transporter